MTVETRRASKTARGDPGLHGGYSTKPYFRPHIHVLTELLLMSGMFSVLGWRISSAHWTSIWEDREFSGWVAGMALRIDDGSKLYTDGTHSPMPPLPTVLVRILAFGEPRWITEARLNFVFQCLILLVMYLGLRRLLGLWVALIAVLAAAANFFALPKVLLYDATAQFCVAVAAVVITGFLLPRASHGAGARSALLATAAATAACLLCKQSTGGGLLVGACSAIAVSPSRLAWKDRAVALLVYVGSAVAFVAAGLIALTPFIDLRGCLSDVFIHGAEPKGGKALASRNLPGYAAQIVWPEVARLGPAWAAVFALTTLVMAGLVTRELTRPKIPPGTVGPDHAVRHRTALAVASVASSALAYLFMLRLLPARVPSPWYGFTSILMAVALLTCVALVLGHRFGARPGKEPWSTPLVPLFCVSFPSAVGHSLSVPTFRWTYDNNPLTVVVLAAVAGLILARLAALPAFTFPVIGLALLTALQIVAAPGFASQWSAATSADRNWRDVRFLDGARMPAHATGMHRLVRMVRRLTPASGDQVLLLPGDPNVEAWFQRPRPKLSSMVVFTDQYWDRYVDSDFRRLRARPPAGHRDRPAGILARLLP